MHRERHLALPAARPLAIAHRGGNAVADAVEAIALGADLAETDIWKHRGRLELRHLKTMGPIPLLWDHWEVHPGWGPRLMLAGLLRATPGDYPLLLDLKGTDRSLAPRIVEEVRRTQSARPIVLCSRNWPLMAAVSADPAVALLYSVGSEEELTGVWPWLARQPHPAVSIDYRLLSPKVLRELHATGATIVAWTVNDPIIARDLFHEGVDGFTTDNRDLLARIARLRERAFDAAAPTAPASDGAP